MALNDDDKKFIKKTVDDAVDKKTTSFEKSAANEKSSRLKAQIEERKERQAYLKQLKELQTNGDATIAQKFELMKEEINSKISQDIKDTVKTTMDTVGKGANTVGRGVGKATSGVDSLITRMASINPILAALYSGTKGVTRDIWNIGAGSVQAALGGAQMAWGAGKAAVGLVGSTMNSMRNMYLKRKAKNQPQQEPEMEMETPLPATPQEEQQEQPNLELPSLLPEQESTSESLKDMQKRIKEIHEATVKSKKEQEDGMKSQLKSLAGMQKTMTAVNDVMKILKAKQMLIVGGVVLGAAALIGLVVWLKGGGLQKLINGAINDKLKEMAPNLNAETKIQAENNLDAQIGILKTNAEDMQNADVQKIEGLYDKGGKEKAWKQKVEATTDNIGLQQALTAKNTGISYQVSTVGNKKKGKTGDFRVPVKCTIFETGVSDLFGDNPTYWIKLMRAYEKEDNNRGWSRAPVIIVDNIKEIHVKANEDIAPNKKIATVYYPYHIYGDYDNFIKKDGKSYQDAMFTDEAIQGMVNQYNEVQDSAYKNVGGIDHHIDKELDTKVGNRKEATVDYIKKRINGGKRFEGMSDDKMLVKETPSEQTPGPTVDPNEFDGAKTPDAGTVTGGAAPIPETTSENEQKVQQTSEQLTEATQPKPTEEKGYVGTLPELGKTNITMETPSIFSPDTYTITNSFDYTIAARNQGIFTTGVNN